MKCGRYEDLIMAALDGKLDERSKARLEEHLGSCPACRRLAGEYAEMSGLLRASALNEEVPDGFMARLAPRLREEERVAPFFFLEKLGLKAIPAFLAIAAFAAGLFLFSPASTELSNSEKLLLRNENPINEVKNLLDEQKPENRNMMLIFADLERYQFSGGRGR